MQFISKAIQFGILTVYLQAKSLLAPSIVASFQSVAWIIQSNYYKWSRDCYHCVLSLAQSYLLLPTPQYIKCICYSEFYMGFVPPNLLPCIAEQGSKHNPMSPFKVAISFKSQSLSMRATNASYVFTFNSLSNGISRVYWIRLYVQRCIFIKQRTPISRFIHTFTCTLSLIFIL